MCSSTSGPDSFDENSSYCACFECDSCIILLAGSLVCKMGVPVELVCAVNVNDIVHRMISTGDFTPSRHVLRTWSTAMDIQVHNLQNWQFVLGSSKIIYNPLTSGVFQKNKQTNKHILMTFLCFQVISELNYFQTT